MTLSAQASPFLLFLCFSKVHYSRSNQQFPRACICDILSSWASSKQFYVVVGLGGHEQLSKALMIRLRWRCYFEPFRKWAWERDYCQVRKHKALAESLAMGSALMMWNFLSGTVQQEWPLKSSSWQFKLLSTYRWPDLFVAWTLRLLVGERFRALFISSFNPTSSLDNIA